MADTRSVQKVGFPYFLLNIEIVVVGITKGGLRFGNLSLNLKMTLDCLSTPNIL